MFPTKLTRPALASLFLLPGVLAHGASIWVEGEDATRKKVEHHGWYDSVKKDVLSGGNWLSHYGNAPGEAEYDVEVAEPGSYVLWARLNPVASAPSWKVDGGAWAKIDLKEVRQQQNIAGDGKIDHRFIAWVKVRTVPLAKGKRTVAFHWEGGAQNSGGLDCFCLTNEPWVPQGVVKPGVQAATDGGGGTTMADAKEAIWIEGEAPTKSTMNRHPWWYDQVKKDVLSGGDWISNFDKDKEGTAEYAFNAEVADSYTLWARANPAVGAKLAYRLDGAAWADVDFKDARGQQNIAADNKPDMRFLAWVKVGDVKLSTGPHKIVWKMNSGAEHSNHGGLDCFVFTRIPFVPQGAQKPTRAAAAGGPDAWFPLLADEDTFDPRSVIDMSKYVPAPAGQLGFLHAVGDKLQFEKAKEPQKFWGVGANVEPGRYSHEQLARRAKYLRKFGINVVRQHPVFDELTTNGVLDPKKMDEYDYWFAELKKNGIYTGWSVFYHFTVGPEDGYPPELFAELPKHGGRGDTYGLITGSPKGWEIRNKWLAQVLQHKNPYTGLRYVDDPALIDVEMQNEDSIFFWNPLGGLADAKTKWPQHAKLLRQRFAAWVKAKYKTDDALKAAWGALRNGDSVSATELALMSPWELDGPGPRGPFAGETRRAGDFIQCLAEMQRGFYEDCYKVIRGVGFKGVIITTAWQVGGAASDVANTWTDSVGDMIDRHNYAGGGVGVHGIAEGKVNNESHLRTPGGGIFSVGMKQVAGKPFSITEWTQSAPNEWKVECAPIMAFYALGLQGWDASWHFIQSGTRLGDGWPGMSSYSTDTPAYMGQFPTLALSLYRGDIKEGPDGYDLRVTREGIFAGTDSLKQDFTKGGYDVKTVESQGVPPEIFAVRKAAIHFQDKPDDKFSQVPAPFHKPAGGATKSGDERWWDVPGQTLHSQTGELTWDYGHERILVGAPKTHAIIGKPGTEAITLPELTATVKTPFVSLLVTALDDAPIAQSKHLLITALAKDKQTGARYSADGKTLETAGTAPLLLEPVVATIKLAGAAAKSVTPCDCYGVPMKASVPVGADGTFVIDGRYRAYYYEVKR